MHRKRNSTQTAVIYKDHEYSYNDIHRQVVFHSENLMDTGSHNVGIFLSNSVNYVIAYFSAAYMDRVIVPIEANSKRNQILSTIAALSRPMGRQKPIPVSHVCCRKMPGGNWDPSEKRFRVSA